ncbi:hypothetical protein E2C01_036865 [Portunus trituberculatus]|uniref:Uncharacterized protein n=1 Tax=Portunus trituberculatus TaxID=210409 RepID=A0A5B7FFI2_PORTR|nr:hypothetical protein [Portunus trituberculatus]
MQTVTAKHSKNTVTPNPSGCQRNAIREPLAGRPPCYYLSVTYGLLIGADRQAISAHNWKAGCGCSFTAGRAEPLIRRRKSYSKGLLVALPEKRTLPARPAK